MAGVQVLHIELGNEIDQKLGRHYDGKIRYGTSEARAGWPAVVLADPEEAPNWAGREHGPAAGQALIDRIPKGRGRPTKNLRIDMILGGPPPFESVDGTPGWDLERVMRWYRMTVRHLAESLPDVVVEHLALHLDERAPHIHFVAVLYNAGVDKVGWTHVRRGLSGKQPRRIDGKIVEPWAQTHFRGIHDRYHQVVSRHFGLARDSGAAKGERVDKIDRRHGEVLRAASGGYSDDYMATADADIKWAAAEGERMRAAYVLARQDGLTAPIDLDHELLRRYSERFPDRKITLKLPAANKTTHAAAEVERRETALEQRAERVDADSAQVDRRALALDQREAALAAREEAVAESEAELALMAKLSARHNDDLDVRATALELLKADLKDRQTDLDRRDRALEHKVGAMEERAADLQRDTAALRSEFERTSSLRQRMATQMGDVIDTLHELADRLEAVGDTAWGRLLRPIVRLLRTLERLAPDETVGLADQIEEWMEWMEGEDGAEPPNPGGL